MIEALKTEKDGFCRVSVLRPSKAGGYIQLSSGGANKFAVLHEVLLWCKGEIKTTDNQHISHLCDKPSCAVKEHVVLKAPATNNSRKNCGMVLDCPHCELKIQACKHSPRCITYVEGFNTWDDFVERGLHQ